MQLLRSCFLTLCYSWLLLGALVARAQQKQTTYNATLEGYNYPFPVKYHTISVEGQHFKMAYMDAQPATKATDARVVVLMHGKNFIGAYWGSTARFLVENGYRVIIPDQLGFGKSDKPALQYTFHQLAQNTKQLLESLQVKQAVVVGHSMGGMLATRFALMYPEFTDKLVLENPIGLEDYRRFVPYRTTEELYREELKRTAESVRNYHKTYYTSWKPPYDEWVNVTAAQFSSPDYPVVAKAAALTYVMIYQQPVVYEFEELRPPTLLVIGQEDRTIVGKGYIKDPQLVKAHGQYPELGKRTAETIPDAKLVELHNIGHIPHLEAPGQFHKALLAFLKG